MPLIIISGYPSSGKTYRAHQIIDYFSARIDEARAATVTAAAPSSSPSGPSTEPYANGSPPPAPNPSHIAALTITHITSPSPSSPHDPSSIFSSAQLEKTSRAETYSAVKRALSPRTIVILDGMNYIKGWRYQLHCEAKAARTGSCVVHVGTTEATAAAINAQRLARDDAAPTTTADNAPAYAPAVHAALLARYEPPSPHARWDTPLFTVPHGDAAPPLAAMWDALMTPAGAANRGKAARPNVATVLPGSVGLGGASEALYVVERVSSAVVAGLQGGDGDVQVRVREQGEAEGGAAASLPPPPPRTVHLPVGGCSAAKLQRLRRQFVSLQRAQMGAGGHGGGQGGGVFDADRVGDLFVDYLNDSFAAEY